MAWPWLAILEVLWVCGTTIWIVTDRRAPASTLAWLVTLAFLPLVGIPVYISDRVGSAAGGSATSAWRGGSTRRCASSTAAEASRPTSSAR
jgi:hypothetical protein